MIIVRMCGGLGNQLFQYSTGRQLSILRNDELYLDLTQAINKYLDVKLDVLLYNIKCKFIKDPQDRDNKLSKCLRFRDPENKFLTDIYVNPYPNIYINGYWQNEKYFRAIRKILLEDITLTNDIIDTEYLDMLKKINNSNSVAIHVRRNDYLKEPALSFFHHYDTDYYNKAIGIMRERTTNPHFFIFSDDMKWCKGKIHDDNLTYVDLNQAGWMDFELIRQCKNFIIPNSTFSWWGAWLSDNKNKLVILPKKWKCNEERSILVKSNWISL